MTWLDEYAEALGRAAGEDLSLSREEFASMLDLARQVAHRTERRFAPVSTFLAGKFVAARVGQGSALEAAVAEALRLATGMLPPEVDQGR